MNIEKVDDKPMVIHTKEKPKVHVKGAPETKIKGRNVLTVQRGPKIAESAAVREQRKPYVCPVPYCESGKSGRKL